MCLHPGMIRSNCVFLRDETIFPLILLSVMQGLATNAHGVWQSRSIGENNLENFVLESKGRVLSGRVERRRT